MPETAAGIARRPENRYGNRPTMKDVAARAGVSVGSLYQYFPNKDALISALHGRHIRQMKAVIEHALTRPEAATLDEALQGLIGAAVEAHRVDSELHRVLETQMARHDDGGEEGKFDDTMQAWLAGLLQRYRGEIVVKDMRLGVFILMHAVHSLIHAAVLERPGDTSLEAVVREIVRLVRAYLTAPEASAGSLSS